MTREDARGRAFDARGRASEYTVRFGTPPPTPASLSLALAIADDDPRADSSTPWNTPTSVDATLFVVDRNGREARIPLASLGGTRPPIEANTRKLSMLDALPRTEPLLHRYEVAAARLRGIDPSAIVALGLRFDRSPRGALHIDDIRIRPIAPIDESTP